MKRGFTLVELSIVLVIIGLLIGGILVAQSMISTAKITAQISQIQQFDAGVENFRTKFKSLPGDSPAYGGDGNGIVDSSIILSGSSLIPRFNCEAVNFWAGIMPNIFTPVDQNTNPPCQYGGFQGTPITSGTGANVPVAKMGKSGSFIHVSSIADTGGCETAVDSNNNYIMANYYILLDPSQAVLSAAGAWFPTSPNLSTTNSAVKPADLLALDSKIDDGNAGTGTVIAGYIAQDGCQTNTPPGNGAPVAGSFATTFCNNGGTYLSSHTSAECTPLIQVGGSAGDPQ